MSNARWWHKATGYQIYPRSFCDANGDGIGDLAGIISRLDHLRDLGVGFVWLSPVYASPMVDNGYDISDYRDIAPEFGTLADFDALVAQADARGIRIVMDLVVNHCSDAHVWFIAGSRDAGHVFHDYFIWRDPATDGGPPDDLRAVFGGSAWTYVPAVGKYYLGFFSPQQPDLNWNNPALRDEIYALMNFWLDRGIGGFRMDVIDLIGKDVDARIYAQGPHLLRHLAEMHDRTLAGRDVLTVGEAWSATPDTALSFCGDRGALDMVFHFNHILAMWGPDHGRFDPAPFNLVAHKRIMADWQAALADDGWNALYLSNHDLPRAVSLYADDGAHRVRSAKMLGLVTHLMRGTPFIYQGEEIGMTNTRFDRIDQFRDIETLGHYGETRAAGGDAAAFLAAANRNGRDNARTPMQWDATRHAGFTSGTPWIGVNPNAQTINVTADRADPDGVFGFYRALVALRRDLAVITHGSFELLLPDDPAIFAYLRRDAEIALLIVANFSAAPQPFTPPEGFGGARLILSNTRTRHALDAPVTLAPYEGFCVRIGQ